MPNVALREITFTYAGAAEPALKGVSLALGPGIVGLVGLNGAGKTTLLRLLLGSLRPDAGAVAIDGVAPHVYRRQGGAGYVPEQPRFDEYLAVGEFLDGLERICRPGRSGVRETATLLGLDPLLGTRLGRLSLGQKRRVELAAALIGEPELLLLDEPTNGLDPLAVAALRQHVLAVRRPGRTVVIASHHLDELQRTVDQLIALRAGRLVGSWDRAKALAEHGTFEQLLTNAIAAPSAQRIETT